MSDLSLFLKQNKIPTENVFYPATTSLCDEEGKPLLWEIRTVPTKESNQLQQECAREVQVPGRSGVFRYRLDPILFSLRLLTSSIVFPDLQSAELLESYGAVTPEDLLQAMIDNPGEFQDLQTFVTKLNKMDVSMQDLVDEAKN